MFSRQINQPTNQCLYFHHHYTLTSFHAFYGERCVKCRANNGIILSKKKVSQAARCACLLVVMYDQMWRAFHFYCDDTNIYCCWLFFHSFSFYSFLSSRFSSATHAVCTIYLRCESDESLTGARARARLRCMCGQQQKNGIQNEMAFKMDLLVF